MIQNNLQMEINYLCTIFEKAYIKERTQELILEPRNNIYFMLGDDSTHPVKTILDLKCKLLEWVSRPASKGTNRYWRKWLRGRLNLYLGTKFTLEDMFLIYGSLGNCVRRSLTIEFIESGYDLEILRKNND